MTKSSVVNLYDVITGLNRFQAKVSSDRVHLAVETLPINITGTSINFTNKGGASVMNAVDTILNIQNSVISEVNDRTIALSNEAYDRISGDNSVRGEIKQESKDRITMSRKIEFTPRPSLRIT